MQKTGVPLEKIEGSFNHAARGLRRVRGSAQQETKPGDGRGAFLGGTAVRQAVTAQIFNFNFHLPPQGNTPRVKGPNSDEKTGPIILNTLPALGFQSISAKEKHGAYVEGCR